MKKVYSKVKKLDYNKTMNALFLNKTKPDLYHEEIYDTSLFSKEQIEEIDLGLELCYNNYSVGKYIFNSILPYINPEISHIEMKKQRLKLESIANICKKYGIQYEINFLGGPDYFCFDHVNSNKYSYAVKREIIEGLERGLDVSIYAKSEFNSQQMSQIKQGLKKGLDVSIYAKPEIPASKMKEIKLSLIK